MSGLAVGITPGKEIAENTGWAEAGLEWRVQGPRSWEEILAQCYPTDVQMVDTWLGGAGRLGLARQLSVGVLVTWASFLGLCLINFACNFDPNILSPYKIN